MLRVIVSLFLIIAAMLIIFACNLATTATPNSARVQSLKSKVEFVSEKSLNGGLFEGNTRFKVDYRNFEFLRNEADKTKEDIRSLPRGGAIKIEVEAASLENASVDKFDIYITAKGVKKLLVEKELSKVEGAKFSHVDEGYNRRVYTNGFIINLDERSVEPLSLEIIDKEHKKSVQFIVYPYYNK